MPKFDWRNPEAYKPIQDVTAPGFAWEFLRRNPEYRRDVRQATRTIPLGESADPAFTQRWRLPFRRRPAALGYRGPRVLAAERIASHRAAYGHAA
ncbi:MAG TPA: DUF6499 domain-containing protein [Mesorhizobium sp.]|jgi:hypothetical protein|nr:DUF6499 domain-containing protein [Mesorhizobium sp.]